jgi:hypothetical protein
LPGSGKPPGKLIPVVYEGRLDLQSDLNRCIGHQIGMRSQRLEYPTKYPTNIRERLRKHQENRWAKEGSRDCKLLVHNETGSLRSKRSAVRIGPGVPLKSLFDQQFSSCLQHLFQPQNVTKRHFAVSKPRQAGIGVSKPDWLASLAFRFSLANASRFIWSFICEYFLNTCASVCRSICVTHSSATPPALSRVA